jgi:hypothetical protein
MMKRRLFASAIASRAGPSARAMWAKAIRDGPTTNAEASEIA